MTVVGVLPADEEGEEGRGVADPETEDDEVANVVGLDVGVGVAPLRRKLSLVTDSVVDVERVVGVRVTIAEAVAGELVGVIDAVTKGVGEGPVPVHEDGCTVWAIVAVVRPAGSMRYVVSSSHGSSPWLPMSMILVPALEKMVAVTIVAVLFGPLDQGGARLNREGRKRREQLVYCLVGSEADNTQAEIAQLKGQCGHSLTWKS